MASGQPVTGAAQRRGRRLRAMLRHEQQSIAMPLAAAQHHSAGPKEKKVEFQQYVALRGQNIGARAREGEVHEKYDAPRERPGILAEPGPQRSDRSLRRSAGDSLPTLALPSLAGEAVDSFLRFLPAAALRRWKEEEEEEKAKDQQVAKAKQMVAKQRTVAAPGASSSAVAPVRPSGGRVARPLSRSPAVDCEALQ